MFFSIITRQAIRRGSSDSVKDLIAAIRAFIAGYNERCQPFVCSKTGEDILRLAPVNDLQTWDTSRGAWHRSRPPSLPRNVHRLVAMGGMRSLAARGYRLILRRVVLETLTLTLGRSLARALVKAWIGDSELILDLTDDVDGLLRKAGMELRERRRVGRALAAICDRVAERLEPLFTNEFAGPIPPNEANAAALAVARTVELGFTSPRVAIATDLDPLKLLSALTAADPDATHRSMLSPAAAKLYEAALSETCTFLVQLVGDLPTFHTAATAELLARERDLLDRLGEALDRLPVSDASKALDFRTRYLRSAVTQLDVVELYGLPAAPRASKRYPLSVSYISLKAVLSTPLMYSDEDTPAIDVDEYNEEFVRGYDSAEYEHFAYGSDDEASVSDPWWDDDIALDEDDSHDSSSQPIEAVLSQTDRLLIRGAPGSGKTTLLQWLGINAAQETMPAELTHLNGRIPFFIRLRRYTNDALPTPQHFIDELAKPLEGLMPVGWAEQELIGGQAIVLIDGVDEVAEADRSAVGRWLDQIVTAFPEPTYVITSRPAAVESDFELPAGFSGANLEPLSYEEIARFIDHWHRATAMSLVGSEARELEQRAPKLREVVRSQPAVRRLATNPLLCAVLCALHSDGNATLPRDRIGLYRDALEVLLERRDAERGVEAEALELTAIQKQLVLEDLAWWLVINGYTDAPKHVATERIGQTLERMQDAPSAEQVVTYLLTRTGLVREPIVGRIDFVHKTFLEYLAARSATRSRDIGVLVENATRDAWSEIVVLAAGVASPDDRSALVAGLLTRRTAKGSNRERLGLLAAACADIAPELDPALRSDVQGALRELVPPRSMAAAESLARAGDIAVSALAYRPGLTPLEASSAVRALGLIGSPEALQQLISYAEDGRNSVTAELLRQARQFVDMDYGTQVLARARLTKGSLSLAGGSRLQGLDYIDALRSLTIDGRGERIALDVLQRCQRLRRLTIKQPLGLTRITDLGDKDDLTGLRLEDAEDLETLHGIQWMALRELRVQGAPHLQDIMALREPEVRLRALALVGLPTADLSVLTDHYEMTSLELGGGTLTSLHSLARLHALRHLHLKDVGHGVDLGWLERCPDVSDVKLENIVGELALFSRGQHWKGPTNLAVSRCPGFVVSGLEGATATRALTLTGLGSDESFGAPDDARWTTLDLVDCEYAALAALPKTTLSKLTIRRASRLIDVSAIAMLDKISSIELRRCEALADISPLSHCRKLKRVTIDDLAPNVDLSPLSACRGHPVVVTAGYADALRRLGVATMDPLQAARGR